MIDLIESKKYSTIVGETGLYSGFSFGEDDDGSNSRIL